MAKCFITDIDIEYKHSGRTDVIEYPLQLDDKFYYFTFSDRPENWLDSNETGSNETTDITKIIPAAIKDIKHILRGLVLNKKLLQEHCSVHPNFVYYTNARLREIIKYYNYPKTPEEKANELFSYLYSIQTYDGEECHLQELYETEWKKYYFKNENEMHYYLETLQDLGLINLLHQTESGMYLKFNITISGLRKAIELSESGRWSNKCFVAMSFDKEDLEEIYRGAIFPVLGEYNFDPILIINEEFESDKTINDAIVAGIKKSKFIIADFTKQKRNV